MSTIQRGFNWFSLNFKIEFIFPQSKKMCGFFLSGFFVTHGLPHWPSGEESVCNAGDSGSIPGSGRCLGEGDATTPVFLPGKSHGQRSLQATVYRVTKELGTAE